MFWLKTLSTPTIKINCTKIIKSVWHTSNKKQRWSMYVVNVVWRRNSQNEAKHKYKIGNVYSIRVHNSNVIIIPLLIYCVRYFDIFGHQILVRENNCKVTTPLCKLILCEFIILLLDFCWFSSCCFNHNSSALLSIYPVQTNGNSLW